jgi:cysteine synthase A
MGSGTSTPKVPPSAPPVYNGMVDAIGNTPLILLKGPSERTGCNIYGKAEFLNPGGSVKDRAAKSLIEGLELDGKLQPGSTVVEGTAGNTGIGLAYVCNAKGYKCVIVIPRTQSQEKKNTLRQAGATLVEVDAVGYKNDNNYIKVTLPHSPPSVPARKALPITSCTHRARAPQVSGRLAEQIPGGVWANQFDNTDNRMAHYHTTAPEIVAALPHVDAFSCAAGTGGTVAGCSMYFKKHHPHVKVGLTDPQGANLHRYYKCGELKSEGSSITDRR